MLENDGHGSGGDAESFVPTTIRYELSAAATAAAVARWLPAATTKLLPTSNEVSRYDFLFSFLISLNGMTNVRLLDLV